MSEVEKLINKIDQYSLGEFLSITESLSDLTGISFEVVCAVSPEMDNVVTPIIIASEHDTKSENEQWLPCGYGELKEYIDTCIKLKQLLPKSHNAELDAEQWANKNSGFDANILDCYFRDWRQFVVACLN